MGTAIGSFTDQLHSNLEAIEDRTKLLRKRILSAPRKAQAKMQSKLHKAKTKLDVRKTEFDGYRTKLKTQLEEKEAEVGSNIEEWKVHHELQKLKIRAKKAEEHAATVTFLAMVAMDESIEATLAAIVARLDVEAVTESKKKS